MRENQRPQIYPGFAIFRFQAGIIQMIIRILVAVLLIACLITSAVHITADHHVSSSIDDKYYFFLLQLFTALLVTSVTGFALCFEFIYFMLRFLNLRCYNNYYKIYGALDIIRYSFVAIGLSLSVLGYADGVKRARDGANWYDREAAEIGEVDTASEELRDVAIEYAVYAALCGVTVLIIGVSIIWEIIYLKAGCNYHLPVPREGADHEEKQTS